MNLVFFYFNGLRIDDPRQVYILGIGKIKAEGRTLDEIENDIQNKVNENFYQKKSEARFFRRN